MGIRGSITYRLTNPSLRPSMVCLYVMLPLTPTLPTSHLPNIYTAPWDNNVKLDEVLLQSLNIIKVHGKKLGLNSTHHGFSLISNQM